MIHLEIPEAKVSINIPENLAECTRKQFVEMSRFLVLYITDQISFEEFKVLAIHKLLNLQEDKEKPEEAWANLAFLSERLFHTQKENGYFRQKMEEAKEKLEIVQDNFFTNPIQKIRIGIFVFEGPDINFTNINAGQYMDALNAVMDYEQTREIKYLYQLFYILYRRRKYLVFGKPLTYKSNEIHLKKNSIVRNLDLGYIYGCFMIFTFFQTYLNNTAIMYNGSKIDMKILFESSGDDFKSNIPGLGMKAVLYEIAESGVFGNLEEVRKINNWEILMKMYDSQKKYLDNVARSEKNKTQN